MYPNNQAIEIFGEEVQWPGVDANGKFTNGSFTDPMVKPSFIPAETINLVLDNLTGLIEKCNEAPNSTTAAQLAALVTPLIQAQRYSCVKKILWVKLSALRRAYPQGAML
jgi:hypothetical protein